VDVGISKVVFESSIDMFGELKDGRPKIFIRGKTMELSEFLRAWTMRVWRKVRLVSTRRLPNLGRSTRRKWETWAWNLLGILAGSDSQSERMNGCLGSQVHRPDEQKHFCVNVKIEAFASVMEFFGTGSLPWCEAEIEARGRSCHEKNVLFLTAACLFPFLEHCHSRREKAAAVLDEDGHSLVEATVTDFKMSALFS
jgi:hypothetical protein